jgi:hypothetical protein
MLYVEIALSGNRGLGLVALVSERAAPLVLGKRWFLAVNGYVVTSRGEYLHRTVTQAPKGADVDHISFDRLDCRDENLRVVTRAQNRCHNRARQGSIQPYKGVRSRKRGTFMARVTFEGVEHYLGTFATAKDAAIAYDKKALELFGEMAHLNFPEEVYS